MEKIKQELEKHMAMRYEAEFSQVSALLEEAYAQGLLEGKTQAKQDMIKLLQGEDK